MANKKALNIGRAAFWWMMRSLVYIGKVIVPSYKDEAMMIVPDQHEPIISQRLYYQVQDVLEGKKRKDLPSHTSKREDLPLRGYFKCTACGKNLTGSASKGNGGKYFYYHCKNGCRERFRATEANDSFYEYLDEISGNEKAIKSWEKILRVYYSKEGKEKQTEKEKVSKELELLQKRLENAQMLTLDGALDASEYRNIKAKLEPEIERLIRKQTDLNSTHDDVQEILKYAFHFLRNLPKRFTVATLEEKFMILGSTFPEKLIFRNGTLRTACPDSAISVLIKPRKDFRGNKKGSAKIFALPSGQVEVTGVEPVSKHIHQKLSTCLFQH
jgi:site-specific DNA recombinase